MHISVSRWTLSAVVVGLAASAFPVQPPSDPYLTYRPPSGLKSYPWDDLSSWDTTTSDTPSDHLPTLVDNVFLYSSKNKISDGSGKPMLVTNGVTAATAKLFVGDSDNGLTIGVRVCAGGTMVNAGDVYAGCGKDGAAKSEAQDAAWLEVENGGLWEARSNFFLGRTGKGSSLLLVKEGGVFACSNEFVVGESYGLGIVTNAGTMNIRNFFVGGAKGTGRMEVTGTLNVASKFTVGRHANSTADLHLAKGSTFVKQYGDGKPVYIGHASNCTATVALDCNLTLTSNDKIYLGSGDFGRGRLVVGEDATVDNVHSLYLGVANESDGTLELRGGTVKVRGSSTTGTQSIFIGNESKRGDVTSGRIVGYGRIGTSNGQNLRMRPYGQFIADGGGVARDLNFADIRTIGTNANDNVNGCGTNGWFAVNKGRFIYPRSQNCTIDSTSHPTIGDYPSRNTPTMLNSFRYTLVTKPTGASEYFNYAELYATDRDDIPAGLPTGKNVTVAGVWRFGLASNRSYASDPIPIAFGGMKVKFRYDTRAMKPGQRVSVYHHDGTATGSWKRISAEQPAFATLTEPAENLIETTTALDSTDETWNAGWFAVVADGRKGMYIVFK